MKKEEILAFIQSYMPKAMRQLEQSHEQGHIVYPIDVLDKYDDFKTFYEVFQIRPLTLYKGYTSSNAFELLPHATKFGLRMSMSLFYQLKEGYTPSEALDDVLTNGITVIDCVEAINLAWYLCIRALLIHADKTEGHHQFNQLFSQKDHPFIISGLDMYSLTGSSIDDAYFTTVPVLGHFIKKLREENKNYTQAQSDPLITPGTRVTINNDPEYLTKHRLGNSGAINVMAVGKNQFMGFGLGTQPLTETEILAWLEQEWQNPSLESQKTWLNPDGKMRVKQTHTAGYFSDATVQFDIDILEQLVNDFPGVLNGIKQFIGHYEIQQLVLFKDYCINNHYPIEIDLVKAIIEKATSGLSLQKDPSFLKNYLEIIASYQAVLDKTLEKPQATQTTLRSSVPTGAPLNKTPCLDLLHTLTQQTFKFDSNKKIFWLTLSKNAAENLAELLKTSHCDLKVSCKKISNSENYCVTVDWFDSTAVNKIAMKKTN